MQDKIKEILKTRQGFIAALDQSGGSSKKTLANYGVTEDSYANESEMFELIHKMRCRIISSPVFTAEKVLAVILFEYTMNNKIEGIDTVNYLLNKNIYSFLKIDVGLEEEQNGVKLLKKIPNLESRLKVAVAKGVIGTKMRSVIYEANNEGIKQVVRQQFALAKIIASFNLIPIIEPEVDIYAIEKFGCEQILKEEIKKQLATCNFDVIFKFTLPEQANFYDELLENSHVLKLVALSGGYTQEKACELLKQNKNMIASFSRGLLENLNVKQNEGEFNEQLNTNLHNIFAASIKK